MTDDERARRFGHCDTCGAARDMRGFDKFFHDRRYAYLEVYCARCRFDEIVAELDLTG